MYKSDSTNFLVRNIPVNLWKKCRAKAMQETDSSMNEVILSLLQTWEQGEGNGLQKHA